jgi:hypothetical protein
MNLTPSQKRAAHNAFSYYLAENIKKVNPPSSSSPTPQRF